MPPISLAGAAAAAKGQFEARVREEAAGQAMLERVIEPMLRAGEALRTEYGRLHREMLSIVEHDAVCRRLIQVPGVGALVAITFKSAVDDPGGSPSREPWALQTHDGFDPTACRRRWPEASGRAGNLRPWHGAQER
jgi:transposase